ncbi:MAG: tetratricopeptide repeat protein [Austwickia sp.]|nr:tetratricopeptide repeat protein [Austwickia sp.]MBK8436893.1 tetratricopeptide repeat protein [Austwickia sp.]MBK9100520.1 tetratricopeptide repeat protein [Austwickia sp.]
MTKPPTPSGALRGAVDLSSLGSPPASASGAAVAGEVLITGTDAAFQEIVLATREVAALVVLWSSRHPETRGAIDNAVAVAGTMDGRLQVVEVDVETNPGVAGAFQVQQIPMTMGLVAGQPLPLFAGVSAPEQIKPVVEELLRVAAQHGVTGRVTGTGAGGGPDGDEPPPLPPLHQEAYDAIERGDLKGAEAAYQKALADSPGDEDARIGLAQVQLLARTASVDLAAARAAAAADPDDVEAQIVVADLDLLGGHIEDAFTRLIDLVRRTTGDERERARKHLVELFDVTGAQDERVVKARRALMSALF